jgi:pimeloyl-ACP methyl ester carboxylesterase
LVLDSVVPYQGVDALQVDVMRAARRVLAAACRAQQCPGDPVSDLAAVVRRDHDGVTLFELVVAISAANPSFDTLLPALRAARRGETGDLDRLVAAYGDALTTPAEIVSSATHASASCADQVFPWGRSSAPLGGRAAAVRRAAARHTSADFAPFDRATAVGNSVVRECEPWPPIAPAQVRRPARLPAVPTLLLAGGRDLSTPLEYARSVLARSPQARLVVEPGAGHVVTGRDGTGRAAVREFLLSR